MFLKPLRQRKLIFFAALSNIGANSSFLSLAEPYSDQFIPESLRTDFPLILTELYEESLLKADYDDVLKHYSSLNISFTQEEADAAEKETKDQSMSDTWFRLRAGRVTAS